MSERASTRHATPLSQRFAAFTGPQSKVPRVLGLLTYLIGIGDIITGLRRGLGSRLHPLAEVLPGSVANAASAASVVAGILLLFLAHALTRRKRRAWRASVALLSLSVLLHAGRVELIATAVSAVVLIVLIVTREQFHALGDPTTRWRAARVFVAMAVISVVLGLILVESRRHAVVGGPPSLQEALWQVLTGLVGLNGPLVFVSDRTNDVIGAVLLGLGIMTLLVPVYLALRAPEPRPMVTDEDETRLRALLERSPDSLGYFNLRRDKSVIWSESGKAAIAYRVVSGVMLASGDPLGDPEAWPGAIAAFLREAELHAWRPAVIGCSERAGHVWTRETGFDILELGDEAVVDAASFTLEGRAMRNVRQMVKRIGRAGYTTEVVRAAQVTEGDRRRALADASAWRGTETERGFSMALGRLVDPVDPDCVFVVARQDGVIRAFLQFVPWGSDGMSLDVMRRDRTADPGVNELMIVEALRAAPELGVKRVSLNFAAFRSAFERGERLGAGPMERAWYRVLKFASRWFQIESLYRFNAKFQPHWTPRFVVYPATRDVPRIALAALEAEAFLTWPRLRFFSGASS
ncbi:phosphatidylglycerol lysyltransferase domain-containing protein [Oryzihumus sp.]|uniref:phosphatidylglycerol lysyltransferase domain-containing protein n=1 Tax=Oryzihumus sp. TaxID=1968903 RepID=UPI002EDA638A